MARLIMLLLAGYGAVKLGQRFAARVPDIEHHGTRDFPDTMAERAGDGVTGRPA